MFIAIVFITANAWKATKMSFNRWTIKQIIVPSYNGISFHDEKKRATKTWLDMVKHQMCIAKEINLESLCAVWFQIYDILEKAKL